MVGTMVTMLAHSIFGKRNMFKNPVCFILFIAFIISLSACNAHKSVPETNDSDTATLSYQLPEGELIPEAEKNKIVAQADTWYQKYIANSNFVGSVLIAKKGTVVYEKYKGELKNGQPVSPHTPFHIASVSKTFTASAILRLQEKGKLNINDPVADYFPGFNYPGVTIKTLLNHRSGLPNYLYFMEKLWPDKNVRVKNEDVLNYLIQRKPELPDAVAADTRFSYCNTNYALLALIIEKVTGKPYPEYMRKKIFEPAHMVDTYVFVPADSGTAIPSYTYRHGLIPFGFLDDVYGDKNIYSTTNDLLNWTKLLETDLFLSEETKILAYAPYSNEKPGIKNYGFGWRMNIYDNGKKLIFHNGWWHGNTAAYMRFLDEDVTIIALNNHYSSLAYKAKLLGNIFYPYFPSDLPEEE